MFHVGSVHDPGDPNDKGQGGRRTLGQSHSPIHQKIILC